MTRPSLRRRVHARHVAAVLGALLGVAALPTPAAAFEYDEHCRTSNLALRAALRAVVDGGVTPPRGARPIPARLDTLRALLGSPLTSSACRARAHEPRSYGDLVGLVDFALTPNDFYLSEPNADALEQWRGGRLPWTVLARLGRSRLQEARAAHLNADHFGDRALLGFDQYHRAAIARASEGVLPSALLLNAFADHFLQDQFAPGHVRTPRSGLHDVLSLGIHDHYNRRGVRYLPRDVESLLRFASPDAFLPGDDQEGLTAALRAAQDTGFIARGDKQLERVPVQRLLITLVTARSVADVLTAYLAGAQEGANQMTALRWTGYRVVEEASRLFGSATWTAPVAEVPHGRYAEERGRGFPAFDRAPTIFGGVQTLPKKDVPVREFAWREFVGVETVLHAWPGDWLGEPGRGRSGHVMLMGGAQMVLGVLDLSAGPRARLVYALPAVNAQLSAGGGVRRHFRDPLPGQLTVHYGGGAELGFGLIFLALGVESDAYVELTPRSTRQRRSVALSSALSLTVPVRRR